MSITLRLNDSELATIKNYAQLHGKSVSDVVRTAILERIEDELDMEIAKQAYNEWQNDNEKTYSMDEVREELGLR